MGHHITAIIGHQATLAPLAARFGAPAPTALPFDMWILPLDEARLDMLAMSTDARFDGFTYLNPTLANAIGQTLSAGRALYLETEYFGGLGRQSAALFDDGVRLWTQSESKYSVPLPPLSFLGRLFGRTAPAPTPTSPSPISQGLTQLGVIAPGGMDAFDAIGLGEFRSMEALGIE